MYLILLILQVDILFSNMIKVKINSRNRFLICFLIFIILLLVVIVFFLKNEEFNDDIIDNGIDSSEGYSITFEDSKLNDLLSEYIKSNYEVSINNVNSNYIYGDIHDTSSNGDLFTTKYIFSYNYKTDEFKIYNFDYDYRILNYYILDDVIYASLVMDSFSNNSYNWSIVMFNNELTNGIVLKEGVIVDPISAPVFYYSFVNNSLYAVAIDEKINFSFGIIEERVQNLDIYKIENNDIIMVKEYVGDYINKTGVMLCSIFDIQMYDDELLMCTTDYVSSQKIISINLETGKEEDVFVNELSNGWIITSFRRNDEGIYIGNINNSDSNVGKTSFYNFDNNQLQEVKSSVLYGRTPFILNNMLFHSMENWSVYNILDNSFYEVDIRGKYSDVYLYPMFYVLDNNTILVKGLNNYFYVGVLDFNNS